MADLSGVLGQVPFLAGWKGTDQLRQQEQAGQLAQAQNLMGILSAAQAQQQKQGALQRQEQFRAGIRPGMTEQELLGHARQFVSDPKDLATLIQQEQLKKAQMQNTQQVAMQRLEQNARQHLDNLTVKQRNAATAEERSHWEREAKDFMLDLQKRASDIAAGRLQYDTGIVAPNIRPFAGLTAPTSTASTGALSQPAPAAAPPAPRVPSPADFPRRGPTDGLQTQLSMIQKEIADEIALADQNKDNPQQREVHLRNAQSLQSELGKITPQAAPSQPPAPPNNFDARDLRLQGMLSGQNPNTLQGVLATVTPPPQPAAPATATAPAAPAMPPMPPEIAAAPKRVQDKWRLDQTKSSIAGAGTLNPEALQFTAKQYLAGDRQAVQGYARNATARIALQNAIVDEASKMGMSPEMVAAKIADFAGTMAGSRTVGQRAANISLAATEAQEMLSIVKEQSDKFPRGNFIPWNMALKAYETNTGSPEIAAFGASVNALVNVYARAINPTGVPTVSDKEHARQVLNTVQSPAQVDSVLAIINRELEIAKKAPLTVRQATTRSITGNAPPANGGKPSAADFFK